MSRMRVAVDYLLYDKKGQVVVSIILGLGFSLMFQRVCKDRTKCIVLYAPPIHEVQNAVYKIDDECYQYTTKEAKCTPSAIPAHP